MKNDFLNKIINKLEALNKSRLYFNRFTLFIFVFIILVFIIFFLQKIGYGVSKNFLKEQIKLNIKTNQEKYFAQVKLKNLRQLNCYDFLVSTLMK